MGSIATLKGLMRWCYLYFFPNQDPMNHEMGRILADRLALQNAGFDLTVFDDLVFFVKFSASSEHHVFKGGLWYVKVELRETYPQDPPVITFRGSIYHPNISMAGHVGLDILQEDNWSPDTDLLKIFTDLLPRLLIEPTLSNVQNDEAFNFWRNTKKLYERRARATCENCRTLDYTVVEEPGFPWW